MSSTPDLTLTPDTFDAGKMLRETAGRVAFVSATAIDLVGDPILRQRQNGPAGYAHDLGWVFKFSGIADEQLLTSIEATLCLALSAITLMPSTARQGSVPSAGASARPRTARTARPAAVTSCASTTARVMQRLPRSLLG